MYIVLGTQICFSRTKEAKENFHSFLLPRRSPTFRSKVGFYHLVAGLMSLTALLMKARFSNPPVPIGQDFFNSPALHDESFNDNSL